MKQLLTRLAHGTPLFHVIRNAQNVRKNSKKLKEWEQSGRPVPPPHAIKQKVLREKAEQYGLRVLCETGTYRGDMLEALKGEFSLLYSIELSDEYFRRACLRFKRDKKIVLVHGDSGTELPKIVEQLSEPALFWLDGHYSAGNTARGELDTPIFAELECILKHPMEHVIVIDDARCFGTDPGYPSIEQLSDFVRSVKPNAAISIEYDSIRISYFESSSASRAA